MTTLSGYKLIPASSGPSLLLKQVIAEAGSGYLQPVLQGFAMSNSGVLLDLVSWAHAYSWDAASNLVSESVTDGSSSWQKTYVWSSGLLTNESVWSLV